MFVVTNGDQNGSKGTQSTATLSALKHEDSSEAETAVENEKYIQPVAIIGVSCRFPGDVNNLQAFTDFCTKGEAATAQFPKDRFNIDSWYHPDSEKGDSVGSHSIDKVLGC